MNGSGKHVNWSLSTDTGKNLFSPGKTPSQNAQFLLFLCDHPDTVHSRAELLRAVWGFEHALDTTRTVDVHVRRLRRKIGPVARELITTFRGVGYRLDRTDGTQVDYGA